MKITRRLIALLVLPLFAALLAGCGDTRQDRYQGWVEGVFIFVGPDEAGRVENLVVREGDVVAEGAALFAVDPELQQADLRVAEAALNNARNAFERAQQLLKSGSGSQKAFDDAEANLREAEARANAARTRLTRRKLASPVAGAVQQIYYRQGEMVPAGRAVISIIPPGNVKVRFFVPQAVLPAIALGDPVSIACDGCEKNISGRISFISAVAEYTPPVIYSQEERSKLVFLVEARPDDASKLRVGQPVSAEIVPREAKR
jgi:HlyD family secretion protein